MFKNIIANFVGRFWSILSTYLFIPLYIKILGIESYSVISFSLVVLGVVSIMDSGLTSTLSKEFASKQNDKDYKSKLLASLEVCYAIITVIIIGFFLCFSDYIASHWLNLQNLDSSSVSFYLKILSIGVAFQMLSNFYLGGIIGLEQQVRANVYQIIWGMLRNGVVIILLLFKPTLTVFFAWQALVTIIYVLVLRYSLQTMVNNKPTFSFTFSVDKKILKKVAGFAGGMLLISIVSSINTQLDKIVISKLLKIEELGFYNIAGSMSQAILVVVTPFSIALLPRFTVLFSEFREKEASDLFQKILKIVAIIVFAGCSNIIFNSEELFWSWTGDKNIATQVSSYIPYLTLGTSLLAILSIPFCIAIANSYTKLNNIVGILSLCITIPGYYIMVKRFGPEGASICWLTVHVLLTPIYFHFINKKFLPEQKTSLLLFYQIILPGIVTFVLAYLFSIIPLEPFGRTLTFLKIGIYTIFTFSISSLILISRAEIKNQLSAFTKFLPLKK